MQQESQGIHIDALTGAFVDEDRINDLSRTERNAQLQKGLKALQLLARPHNAGGLGPAQLPVETCPNGYQWGMGLCHPLGGNWSDTVQPYK